MTDRDDKILIAVLIIVLAVLFFAMEVTWSAVGAEWLSAPIARPSQLLKNW